MIATLAAVSHRGTALWYLTRATGLVSLILLSGTVVLGIVSSVGWTAARWPRFISQAMHRNLSLFCLALIAIHIVTTVADGYVPIGFVDGVVPFLTPYRPLWIGLGALAFDMLLAVAITSGLRRRIGVRSWRGVHYLAYVCWPIALLHGLGSGTDARLPIALLTEVLCVASVVGAVAWRVAAARDLPSSRRLAAAGLTTALLIGIGTFAALGPLQPGWSKRSGTSAALLAQLNARFASISSGTPSTSTSTSASSTSDTAPTTTVPSSTSALPAVPFSKRLTGTIATSNPNSAGDVEVRLTLQVQGTDAPLVVQLIGTAVNGGVSMSTSNVTFGNERGAVTALNGSTIAATVKGASDQVDLVLQLSIDQQSGAVSGSVSATSGGRQ
jgi:sulfoxide reductase heme-binding subunit YedZ